MAEQSDATRDIPEGADAPRPASATPAVSVWEDFVDILYTPARVFSRREQGSFWIPMLVVAALVGGVALMNSGLMQPIMDAEFDRGTAAAMRANPQLTPEMMEKGKQFTAMGAKVGAFVFVPIVIFLVGLSLWIVGKLVDAKQTLHAAIVVAALAYVPRVLEGIATSLQGFVVDPSKLTGRYQLSLGVGRFLDPDKTSPMMLALLGRVDVFTIWVTVLLAIGLSVTGRVSRPRAAIAAALVWLVGATPALYQATRM